MTLPTFKYHPDPVSTGAIVASDTPCVCCGQARGYIYTGPVYGEADLDDALCPWCIADGSAAARFDAAFTDEDGVGAYGDGKPVPASVVETVALRTPGFSGWQQEQWWTHCGDAGAFLGRAGHAELERHGAQAIASIQDSTGLSDGPEWEHFFRALDKDGAPTAYVFRCTVCGALGGYQDSH